MPSVPSFPIRSSVPVIGIVGGVGSGKSTVVRHVGRIRLLIIDADQLAHEQLRRPEIVQQIQQAFGSSVLTEEGSVDHARMAERVFGSDADDRAARRQLEQILHPVVRERVMEMIAGVSEDVDAIILDAALLLEAGWADDCDALIFVETPLIIRQFRTQQDRGWSADELNRREACQMSLDLKKKHTGFVVDNSGTLEESVSQLERCLAEIIRPIS